MQFLVDEPGQNIKIIDSFKYVDRETQIVTIKMFMEKYEWFKARSLKSYVREWRAHNRLYKLGLFKDRTKDVDLNVHEKWYRRLGYFLLGG